MCLFALYYRVAADAPVVVGANREEFRERGGEPPQILEGTLRSVGGRDPRAGGTWLGVNEAGLLVALTNRPRTLPTAKGGPSRGQLVRQLLGCPDAARAVTLARDQLEKRSYDGCNVICVDGRDAVIIQAGDWLRIRPLPPGVHVVANGDLNNAADGRVAHVMGWLRSRPQATAAACLENLREVCCHHLPEYPPVCNLGVERGTVSSILIALPGSVVTEKVALERARFWYAPGPPCVSAYQDYSPLLRQLAGPRSW